MIGRHGRVETMINITNNEKIIYIDNLVNRVYKILPLYEKDNKIPKLYIQRLLSDIKSADNLFEGILIHIIVQINVLLLEDMSFAEIKSLIFNCINLVKKIKEGID